jgi:hypothetical protein
MHSTANAPADASGLADRRWQPPLANVSNRDDQELAIERLLGYSESVESADAS